MPKVIRGDDGKFLIQCPACEYAHWWTEDRWEWNNNFNSPTVTPSILVEIPGKRCHSFITMGVIKYLDDCDHDLRGQSVVLPQI